MEISTKYNSLRSYVLRQGRMTKSQSRALDMYWSEFGIEVTDRLNFKEIFSNDKPIVVEIGFGMGQSLAEMALTQPQWNFIGIEVFPPGVGALLQKIKEQQITNIRIMKSDAKDILKELVDDNSLDRIHIFFPDPWPKKRHHKRRLIQPDFIEIIEQKLKSDGKLHLATDWLPYAEHMLDVLNSARTLENSQTDENPFINRPNYRPMTKFELRGEKLGHQVKDLIFSKP